MSGRMHHFRICVKLLLFLLLLIFGRIELKQHLRELQVHTPTSLQGFEFALIKMIADFIDVPIPYGKPLRRLRDIHDALLSLVYS